jgi:hypothetical protein
VGDISFQGMCDPCGDRSSKAGIIKGHALLSESIVSCYNSKILFMCAIILFPFFPLSFSCKLPLIQDRRPLCYVTMVKGVTIRVNTQLKILEHSVGVSKRLFWFF